MMPRTPLLSVVALWAALLAAPAARADVAAGQALFNATCVACHGPGGSGIPGLAPALAGALGGHLASPQGKTYLVSVLLAGLSGPIESKRLKFNSAMPNLGLKDEQVADVLAYLVGTLNQAPEGFEATPADVSAARANSPTAAKNLALRKALLGGK